MDVPRWGAWLVAVARFYLRPLRRALRGRRANRPAGQWPAQLGPLTVDGRQLVLRTPRMSDAQDWRAIRLAERERIEPWWVSSSLSWAERHTEPRWVSLCLQSRRAARAGLSLPLVVEVDGRFAGQCGLEWVQPHVGTGELGIWLDSQLAGRGLGVAAVALVVDHAFDVLGLHRVTAPVCPDNVPATRTMRRAGMVREGTMVGFLDVGGRRRDHDLWAITADRAPRQGLVHRVVEQRVAGTN